MPPQSSQAPTANKYSGFEPSNRLIAVIIVAVAVIAGLGLWYHHSHASKSATNSAYNYTYNQLDSFTVPGPVAGSGISFSKPKELTTGLPKTPAHISQATLQQMVNSFNIAQITASSQPGSPAQIGAIKASTSSDINNRSSNGFLEIVSPSQRMLNNLLDPAYGFNFAAAKPFTNSNIKSNAWEMDFTASVPGAASSVLPAQQGTLIYVIGKTTVYYLVLNVVSNNWQSNHSVWQSVLDSIKIDQ